MTSARNITLQLGGSWRGNRGNAPCPVCQPERRPDQVGLSTSEANGKILLHCFKTGCDFVDIVNALDLSPDGAPIDLEARRETERKRYEYASVKLSKARSLWEAASPIADTVAESYLRGRGITFPLPNSLRFVPNTYHSPSDSRACAMVANVEPTGGVHRTYFTKQGERLTKSAKMMLGPCAGGAVHLSNGLGLFVVCEGAETGLSLVQLLSDRDPEVWAALSTSGMKALALPSGSRELIVATDGDEPGRQAANALAARASALGWVVSVMDPGDGTDFNDVLMAGGL